MLQLIPSRNTPIRSCALGRRILRLSRPSLTWVQNARVRKEPWDRRSGSQTEVFPLARHVRSNLKSRRCQAAPPFPKSANSRRRCELIHIPDRPSCASFCSYVQGRPVSCESRWRLTLVLRPGGNAFGDGDNDKCPQFSRGIPQIAEAACGYSSNVGLASFSDPRRARLDFRFPQRADIGRRGWPCPFGATTRSGQPISEGTQLPASRTPLSPARLTACANMPFA